MCSPTPQSQKGASSRPGSSGVGNRFRRGVGEGVGPAEDWRADLAPIPSNWLDPDAPWTIAGFALLLDECLVEVTCGYELDSGTLLFGAG